MEKDFDSWNSIKKAVDAKPINRDLFFHEREVWWCSVGLNVGAESDGKHENFERPCLIIKKFNNAMLWVVPLTSKEKMGDHFQKITHDAGVSWAYISQLKTISTKRLVRKIGMVPEIEFNAVLGGIGRYIRIGPRSDAGPSEAEATNK
jgi:mRNA interferase MazF